MQLVKNLFSLVILGTCGVASAKTWTCKDRSYSVQIDDRQKSVAIAKAGSPVDVTIFDFKMSQFANGEKAVYFSFEGPSSWEKEGRLSYGVAEMTYVSYIDQYTLRWHRFDDATGEREFIPFLNLKCQK